MNLIALDFTTIALIVLALALLGISRRVVWALAHFSERLIISVVQHGMPGVARSWLAILVGYDEQVYQRSRFEFRNQVAYRFAVLWGCAFLLLPVLFVLKDRHIIDSISQAWLVCSIGYIGFRCLLYWNRTVYPPRDQRENQHVNEQTKTTSGQGPQLIRRWDYLDELFSQYR